VVTLRSAISNASAGTGARIRMKRFRIAVIIVVVQTWVFTAVVPALLLIYLGSWRGALYELSPSGEFSLLRFWLPFFGLSLLIPPAMVAMEFVAELAKSRGRRSSGKNRDEG